MVSVFIFCVKIILIKINDLWKLKKIEKISNSDSNDSVIIHHSNDIEKMIFNNKHYLEENSFATTHQQVNVYSKPEKKYEVRCESSAIDIQIKE